MKTKSTSTPKTEVQLSLQVGSEAIQMNEDDLKYEDELENKEYIDVLEITFRREQPTHANWA